MYISNERLRIHHGAVDKYLAEQCISAWIATTISMRKSKPIYQMLVNLMVRPAGRLSDKKCW